MKSKPNGKFAEKVLPKHVHASNFSPTFFSAFLLFGMKLVEKQTTRKVCEKSAAEARACFKLTTSHHH